PGCVPIHPHATCFTLCISIYAHTHTHTHTHTHKHTITHTRMNVKKKKIQSTPLKSTQQHFPTARALALKGHQLPRCQPSSFSFYVCVCAFGAWWAAVWLLC